MAEAQKLGSRPGQVQLLVGLIVVRVAQRQGFGLKSTIHAPFWGLSM